MLIFQSTVAHSLKATLSKIIDDDKDGLEKNLVMPKYLKVMSMEDAYEDELEMGGPGLASEKQEGATISMGTIKEGAVTRYIARTFALRLGITQEAMEDKKYPEAIDLAKRLKRAMFKTIDIDAANIPTRAFNSTYTGGDGVCLGSSSHTLPQGGTFSNIMATPMSPSRAALIVANSALKKLPGHDGIIEGYKPTKLIYPTEQWGTWGGILRSTHAPEPGAFNEVNVVNSDMDLTPVEIKYWVNTTTNWGLLTDCDSPVNFRYRIRPQSNTWTENGETVMYYSIRARWGRGWSDPRAFYGVNA